MAARSLAALPRAVARVPARGIRLVAGLLRGLVPLLPALAGLAGAAVLIAADRTAIHSVRVVTVTVARVTGGERHHHLLLAGGVVAALLVVAAVLRRSRPAAIALLALGVAAALVALVDDAPSAHDAGRYGLLYAHARGEAGPAQTLELVAAVLLAVAGAGLLLTRARGRAPSRTRTHSREPVAAPD